MVKFRNSELVYINRLFRLYSNILERKRSIATMSVIIDSVGIF